MVMLMQKEAYEAPSVVARQLKENQALWQALCNQVQKLNPPFVMTVARGSSDYAATFLKYLFEVHLGLPTVSAAPSVFSLYKRSLNLKGALVIGLSQSGQSPDICEVMTAASEAGAYTVALVNQVHSPLAEGAKYVVPVWAGVEQAVAATKSYIATLAALLQFVAIYTQDPHLLHALDQLPECLSQAAEQDWSSAVSAWQGVHSGLTIGRGFGFPIAQEAALKLKETGALHVEAFSSAEVMHGPFALIGKDFPALMFTQNDPTLPGSIMLANRMQQLGARPFIALPSDVAAPDLHSGVSRLSLPPSVHPLLDPLMSIQAFYPLASRIALARGFNPDKHPNLQKVTSTR